MSAHIHDVYCDTRSHGCPDDPTYTDRMVPCMAGGPSYDPGNEEPMPVRCTRMQHTSGEHMGYGNSMRVVRWPA